MSALASSRLGFILVAALTACGDSLGPGPGALGTTYVLERVVNDPLPAVLATNEFGTIHVFSQTLRLIPGGAGTLSEVSEIVPHQEDLPREGRVAGETEIRWVVFADGRIEIDFLCSPNASCIGGPHLIAHVKGPVLQARWGTLIGRAPLYYAEVAVAR